METIDRPKILKRFNCGGDPNTFVEVLQDKTSNTKWVRLWIQANNRWFAHDLAPMRAARLQYMLKDSEKALK